MDENKKHRWGKEVIILVGLILFYTLIIILS